ncbi:MULTISPECIES: YuzB family protein [Paenibacillus]|uniref:DUF1450 domain-containing protein n=1 Tax=Paenibacillus campinasensis TaxID=66347 RepID=A0A268EXV0_9BACL|nr:MULTISPECIES: YuzB family protein [Paenibacillus]MUG66480.1 DUF1450 domain-containing protein [Paenibacillus campinasensis]PAD77948.1 UDP-N-acetylmuramoylalanine--D-glutamate ligase [Paenibacillus campinasensis]PAK52970.1 UDP-N-acetylmuramoylalanine--D-glutamate ligase [Paenibacillus sp. 7541]
MSIMIEFCTSNSYFGTDQALQPLAERFDCQIIEYGCLTDCGQCYLAPFAYVDGDRVEAVTSEELFALISQKLELLEQENEKG